MATMLENPKDQHIAGSAAPIRNHAAFIWSVAGLLQATTSSPNNGKVILPLTDLRPLDC